MGERQTVADSKRRFYGAYPRVIPGLYRRVVDELRQTLRRALIQDGWRITDAATGGFIIHGSAR